MRISRDNGIHGATTLRGKQMVHRVDIDSTLIKANMTATSTWGKSRINLAKNFDSNVHGSEADVSGQLGVRN